MLQKAQSERNDVNFVFLNQGEPSELVQEFLSFKELLLKYVLIDAHSKASAEFGTRALPTTLLFDAQGNLVDSHLGEISHGKLEEMYEDLGVKGSREK